MSLWISYSIVCSLVVGITYCLCKIGKDFEDPILLMLICGYWVRVVFLLSTVPGDEANDWGSHLTYAQVISGGGTLPRAKDCFECYHPPLYHLVGAGFIKPLANWDFDQARGLQWMSLGIFMLALFAFVNFLRKSIPEKRTLYWACALLIFWPRGIPLSITINNDVSVYLFSALALTALVMLEKRVQFAAFAGLALLSKTSGILLYPIGVGYQWITQRKIKIFNKMNAVLMIGLMLSLGFTWFSRRTVTGENAIVGNSDTIARCYEVGKKVENFLCFDAPAFVKYPDIGLVIDQRGRQCFWNFLWKTSIVTEKDVGDPVHQALSISLSILLLGVLAIVIVGGVVVWRSNRTLAWLHNLNLFWFLAGLMVIRYLKPMGASNDFRYVFPILPTLASYAAYGTIAFRSKKIVSLVTQTWLGTFVGLSIAYYVISGATR